MRRWLRLAAWMMACGNLGACTMTEDTAYDFTFTPPPQERATLHANGSSRPSGHGVSAPHGNGAAVMPANGGAIQSGQPIRLEAHQQEAIVAGVSRWLKDPRSAYFGSMQAVRDGRGIVTVCGWIDGRNSAGVYRGLAPYIGILVGARNGAEFIVVAIGGTRRERADVLALCEETGASRPA
jgi:hypothetical protein